MSTPKSFQFIRYVYKLSLTACCVNLLHVENKSTVALLLHDAVQKLESASVLGGKVYI